MQQIIIILQLVLALLSNPETAQNPQVQALASQAINEATQALSVQQTQMSSTISVVAPTSTDFPQPIQIIVTNPTQTGIGTPDITSVSPPIQATTTLPIVKSCNSAETTSTGEVCVDGNWFNSELEYLNFEYPLCKDQGCQWNQLQVRYSNALDIRNGQAHCIYDKC